MLALCGRNALLPAALLACCTLAALARAHDEPTAADPGACIALGRALAVGDIGSVGTRNAPSLIDAAVRPALFWDGRETDLAHQALKPIFNPREMALADAAVLLERLGSAYDAAMPQAFGGPALPSVAHVAQALACFERSLVSGPSAFDVYLGEAGAGAKLATQSDSTPTLAADAARGLALFRGPAACASCHLVTGTHPALTDERFHRRGIGIARLQGKLTTTVRDWGGWPGTTASRAWRLIDHWPSWGAILSRGHRRISASFALPAGAMSR